LQALVEQTRLPDEILVIDNASADGTPAMLDVEFPLVKTIRMRENLGGAGGFQCGIKQAYETGFDWIWVMDDDVRAAPSALDHLLREASQDSTLVAAPMRLDEDGKVAEGASIVYDLAALWCLPGFHQRSFRDAFPETSMLPAQHEVEVLSFEGPLIPRRAVEKVGLPCKEFFIYGDDADYSLRLLRAGYRLCLFKDSVLYRMLPASPDSSLPPAWKARYMIRNTIWLNRIHGANWKIRYLRTLLWFTCYLLSGLLKLRWIRDPFRWYCSTRGLIEAIMTSPRGFSRG
jgi:GT2 family glycosyltransferase